MGKEIENNLDNIGKSHKECFRDKLRNGPLESFSDELYRAYELYNLNASYLRNIEIDRDSVEENILKCKELVTILADLRENKVCWRDETYTDLTIPPYLEKYVQDSLIAEISRLHESQLISSSNSRLIEDAIKAQWNEVTDLLPNTNDLELDESHRLTDSSLNILSIRINECVQESRKLFTWTTQLKTAAFLDAVVKTKVHLNNAVYREVYKCLEFFGWIDYDQLNSHSCNTAKDAKERFIRAKFNRLKNKDFDFNDFIVKVIDSDLYDPRK